MIMQGNTTRRLRLREGLAILAIGAAFLPLNPSLAEPPAPAADVKGETTVTTDVHKDVDKETGKTVTITKTVTTTKSGEDGEVSTVVERIEPSAPDAIPAPAVSEAPAPPSLPAPPSPPVNLTEPVPPAPPAAATLKFRGPNSRAIVMRTFSNDDVLVSTLHTLQDQLKQLTGNPEGDKERNERRVKAIKQAIAALQGALPEAKETRNDGKRARVVIERRLGKPDSANPAAKDGGAGGDVVMEVRDVEVLTEDVRGQESKQEREEALEQQMQTIRKKLQDTSRLIRNANDPSLRALHENYSQLLEELTNLRVRKIAEADKLKHQEDRLSAMEKTLAKVLEELKSLKKEKSN